MSNNKLENFCQYKTAYLLDENFHYIVNCIIDDDLFRLFEGVELPEGWEYIGHGISGAAGFIITFEISELPLKQDAEKIVDILYQLEEKAKKIFAEKERKWNELLIEEENEITQRLNAERVANQAYQDWKADRVEDDDSFCQWIIETSHDKKPETLKNVINNY
jgi:hypothetical protein